MGVRIRVTLDRWSAGSLFLKLLLARSIKAVVTFVTVSAKFVLVCLKD